MSPRRQRLSPNEEVAKTASDKLLRRDKNAAFARRVLTTGSELYDRAFGKTLMGFPLSSHEDASLKAAISACASYINSRIPAMRVRFLRWKPWRKY